MLELKINEDEFGCLRATTSPPYEVLGSFLSGDVQGNDIWAESVIRILEQAKKGTVAHWEATGNAHTVVIDQSGVQIENDYIDPKHTCKLTLDEFENALKQWVRALRTR